MAVVFLLGLFALLGTSAGARRVDAIDGRACFQLIGHLSVGR